MTYYEYLEIHGAELFTVISLPDGDGVYPTVIYRTPYVDADEALSEDEICARKAAEYQKWHAAGYAVVFQHCRGRGKSSGDCVPYIYEREDRGEHRDAGCVVCGAADWGGGVLVAY